MTQNTNPLSQYFRKPGIYVRLPSGGKFYKNSPKLSIDGELAVFPMTAKDEVLLRSPDALLNGEALRQLIKSCCPDVVDPDEMPTPDMDAVLVAIRAASTGRNMPVETTCPCEHKFVNQQNISLDALMQNIKDIPEERTIPVGDLTVTLRPSNMKLGIRVGLAQFTQAKMLQNIDNNEKMSESEKLSAANNAVKAILELTTDVLSECVDSVNLPDGVKVTDKRQIKEWINQLDKEQFAKLEGMMKDINTSGLPQEYDVKCSREGCDKTYKAGLSFDPTTFFDKGF